PVPPMTTILMVCPPASMDGSAGSFSTPRRPHATPGKGLRSASHDRLPRRRRRTERSPAVDHGAARGGVLIGLPRDRALLIDTPPREVADAVREDRLQRRPLGRSRQSALHGSSGAERRAFGGR